MGNWLLSHVITTVMVVVSAVAALNEPRNQCLPHAAFMLAVIGGLGIPGCVWILAFDDVSLMAWSVYAVLLAGWVYAFRAYARIILATHHRRPRLPHTIRTKDGPW